MAALEDIRKDINKIDAEITELFKKRMGLSDKVAASKIVSFAPIYRPEREKEILDKVAAAMPEELSAKGKSFFSSLMLLSREKQYSAYIMGGAVPDCVTPFLKTSPMSRGRICYYGEDGSWSNLAAKQFSPSAKLYGMPSFSDVFSEVNSGAADAGVLPIENSTAGSIREVYDLLSRYNIFISGALTLKIKYCLSCATGSDKKNIKKVFSHAQALSQCREYLEKNGYTAEPFNNTAGAAKYVRDKKNASYAALCNSIAAKEYGLTIIDSDICDEQSNTTRFIVVTRLPFISDEADTISIKFCVDHESGSLSRVLDTFRDLDININKLESRPIPNEKFLYSFYLDFNGRLDDNNIRALLLLLESEIKELKVLGNYRIED